MKNEIDNTVERIEMRELLEKCRYALNFVPVLALGMGINCDKIGGEYEYPYRDELVANVDKMIEALGNEEQI